MPLYAWAILVMGFMMLFGFTPLLVATTLLELDRKHGTRFFDASAGGDPLLWQHLFWIFGHPDVYIQLIPGLGMIAMVIADVRAAPERRPHADRALDGGDRLPPLRALGPPHVHASGWRCWRWRSSAAPA